MSCDANLPQDLCPLYDQVDAHERGGDLDLMLLHYGVEGWAPPLSGEPCLTRANLERLRTDALCVGHLHVRNEARLAGGAVLLNPGATEHIHFGEEPLECGFWVLHCAPGHVEAEYVRLTPQPMRSLPLELTDADLEAAPDEADKAEEAEPADALMRRLLAEIEAAAREDQLLRLRLRGRVKRSRLHALNLAALQSRGSELNFHCQLDTEGLTVYDEFAEVALGYGVSFDAGEELQNVARAFLSHFVENPTEAEICRLAAARIDGDYARLTGGAR